MSKMHLLPLGKAIRELGEYYVSVFLLFFYVSEERIITSRL